jgi:cytochrome c oxidase assembly protein subunit 15
LLAGAGLTLVTLLSGGFVAGLDAGRIFNTFPLMGGRLVPPGYRMGGPWWRNALENPIAAQFHHRLLALLTAGVLLGLVSTAVRSSRSPSLRRAAWMLALAVLVQVSLGIATLLLGVPVSLGVMHQVGGVGVLTAMLVAAHPSAQHDSVQAG